MKRARVLRDLGSARVDNFVTLDLVRVLPAFPPRAGLEAATWSSFRAQEVERLRALRAAGGPDAADVESLMEESFTRSGSTFRLTPRGEGMLAARGPAGWCLVGEPPDAVLTFVTPLPGGYLSAGVVDLDGGPAVGRGGPTSWSRRVLRAAPLVLEYMMRIYGATRSNPVTVAAWELRLLVGLHGNPDGHQVVVAAFDMLGRLSLTLARPGQPLGKGQSLGTLVADVMYTPRGPGRHHDGEFIVTLAASVMCEAERPRGREVATGRASRGTGSQRPLPRAVDWPWGNARGYFMATSTVAPFADTVFEFTPSQSNLRRWLEVNITHRRDAVNPSLWPAEAREGLQVVVGAEAFLPRVYNDRCCPLLAGDGQYLAALGHFTCDRNPEAGWKLAVHHRHHSSDLTGASAGGMMAVMGLVLPVGHGYGVLPAAARGAMDDVQAVVEAALGGVVGVRYGGEWYTVDQARDLLTPAELLFATRWFPFIPVDWVHRIYRALEQCWPDVAVEAAPVNGAQQDVAASSVGRHLAEDRRARGLTQAKLAEVLGVTQAYVSQLEAGVKVPSPTLAMAIEGWRNASPGTPTPPSAATTPGGDYNRAQADSPAVITVDRPKTGGI